VAIRYTKHAKEMLIFRGIKQDMADETVNSPDEITLGKNDKKIYLKDFGKNYLMLVVAEEFNDKIVVTVHWLAKERVKKV